MTSAKTRQRLAKEPWRRLYGTKRWKDTRSRTLIRIGRICERCGGNRSLDVHHIVALKDGGAPYDPNNLEVLCRSCHRAADNDSRQLFAAGPSTFRPADISLPESERSGEKPEKPHEYWVGPDGRLWSRDWGGGTLIVDGEPRPGGSNPAGVSR